MKNRRFFFFFLLFALVVGLCACSPEQLKQDLGDTRSGALLAALETKDAQTLYTLFHPSIDRDAFLQEAPKVIALLPETGAWTLKRTQVNVNTTNNGKQIQETFTLTGGESSLVVTTVYLEDAQGKGYRYLNVSSADEVAAAARPTGTFASWRENDPVQWLLLAFWLGCLVFVGLTIRDVIRRKPSKYVLWIVGCLLFLYTSVSVGAAGFRLNVVMAGILTQSHLLRWTNGEAQLVLGLPLVAILYWVERNKLKRADEAAPAEGSLAQPQIQDPQNIDP